MSENELAVLARNGDNSAFAALVRAYQGPIYNLCYRMLGNGAEAEDATQESFLKAFSQLESYDAARPFKSWLFAIANHHCIDRIRRQRMRWLDIEDEALAPHPALRERTAGPEESALRQEQAAGIETLLRCLPPDNRNVLILRYWYDLSYEEIAQITRTTVSAVKSRLHRARGTMASLLEPAEKANARPDLTMQSRSGKRALAQV